MLFRSGTQSPETLASHLYHSSRACHHIIDMYRRNNNARRGRRGGRNSNRGQSNLPQNTPSNEGPKNIIGQPTLYPRVAVSRLVTGYYNFTNDGINPSLEAINFSLNDIPGYTEFTALFQTYCIEQIEIWIRPEYTVLSDASSLSNSVNVEMLSAIDLVDATAPASVAALSEYQSIAHTSIVSTHYRKFKPSYLVDNIAPTCALLSTASPSTNWYGLKVAVPPCGVAMTFRTIVKFKIALVGLK